jgi:hypothetical protein
MDGAGPAGKGTDRSPVLAWGRSERNGGEIGVHTVGDWQGDY